jgi:Uma2 family endonuclease
MNTLLENPAIRRRVARLSVEDYHRLPELPVELLRGTIIDKMSKSPLHRSAAHILRDILLRQLPAGCLLFGEAPLTVGDSEPEPDLFIAKGSQESFRHTHPTTAELVIEVAVSSLEQDRVKALIYAEAGVPEYWIVRPEDKCVEVYRQPDGQNYREQTTVTASAILESSALPGVKVDLAALLA